VGLIVDFLLKTDNSGYPKDAGLTILGFTLFECEKKSGLVFGF